MLAADWVVGLIVLPPLEARNAIKREVIVDACALCGLHYTQSAREGKVWGKVIFPNIDFTRINSG